MHIFLFFEGHITHTKKSWKERGLQAGCDGKLQPVSSLLGSLVLPLAVPFSFPLPQTEPLDCLLGLVSPQVGQKG